MIDAQGTSVVLEGGTRALVQATGFVDPQYYRLLPGAGYHHKKNAWLLPVNVLPLQPVHEGAERHTQSGLLLRRYQSQAVEYLHSAISGAYIALDVGLGKTIISLQYIAEDDLAHSRPFLVVGPLLSAGAWTGANADAAKHYGYNLVALKGTDVAAHLPALREAGQVHGVFVHHEVLPAWVDWINTTLRPAVVVMDEAHLLRNVRTKAYDAVKAVTRRRWVHKRVALSATPVVNDVVDLWPVLDIVQPHAWGASYVDYGVRYADMHQTEYGWKAGDHETNVDELRSRLKQTLLRRSRAEVRSELPPFNRHGVRLTAATLDARALLMYRRDETALLAALAGGPAAGARLELINALLYWLSSAKQPAALAHILEQHELHDRIFVTCWYKDTADWLCRELRRKGANALGPIHSGVTTARRAKLLEELRTAERAVIVGTMGSTGLSLNDLARCSLGVTVDLWYVPATLLQSEGRLHREGQLADTVEWHYLIVDGTADDVMFTYLERKAATIAKIVDDPAAASLCETLGGKNEEEDMKSFLAELKEVSFE